MFLPMSIPLQLIFEAFDTLVFGLMILAFVAVVGGIVYFEHRKEMALIEAGAYDDAKGSDNWILGAGLVLVALGVADVVNAVWQNAVPGDGLAMALLGAAALVYYYLKHRAASNGATTGPEKSA